jgi:hypothetical protein
MSKTKCPPYTGLGGHKIRRVFELSCGSKKSLDPVEVPPNLQSRCPKVAVQGELCDSVEVPSDLIDLDGQEFITVITVTEKKKLRTERKKNCEKRRKKRVPKEKGPGIERNKR